MRRSSAVAPELRWPRVPRATHALTLVCVAWIGVIWFWPAAHLALPVDDAFYYQRIAWNLAHGLGFTFDGIEPTNGFHPLWVAVLALMSLLRLDPTSSMRLALSIGVVLVRAAVALLARRYARVEGVAAVMLTGFWFTKVFVNGMESALVTVLIALCLGAPRNARALWGLAGGALVLARFDAALFVLPWLVHRRRAAPLAGLLGAAWAAYALLKFGHVLPVSAAVKYGNLWPVAALLAVAATAGALLPRAGDLWPLVAYAIGFVLLGGWGEIWRMVPLGILCLIGASHVPWRWLRIGAVAWIAGAIVTWRFRAAPTSSSPYVAAERSGLWLRDHTPHDAVVAGWDCGIVAAYADRRFFNLEGLVGSWAFYADLRSGKTAAFIDARGVDWIAQNISLPGPSLIIDGVDLRSWKVAHSQCVEFRSITAPFKVDRRLYFVLRRRGPGTSLGQLVESGACSP